MKLKKIIRIIIVAVLAVGVLSVTVTMALRSAGVAPERDAGTEAYEGYLKEGQKIVKVQHDTVHDRRYSRLSASVTRENAAVKIRCVDELKDAFRLRGRGARPSAFDAAFFEENFLVQIQLWTFSSRNYLQVTTIHDTGDTLEIEVAVRLDERFRESNVRLPRLNQDAIHVLFIVLDRELADRELVLHVIDEDISSERNEVEARHNIRYSYPNREVEDGISAIHSTGALRSYFGLFHPIYPEYSSEFFNYYFLLAVPVALSCSASYLRITAVEKANNEIRVEGSIRTVDGARGAAVSQRTMALISISRSYEAYSYSVYINDERTPDGPNRYEIKHNISYNRGRWTDQHSSAVKVIHSANEMAAVFPNNQWGSEFFRDTFLLYIRATTPCGASYLRVTAVRVADGTIEVDAVVRPPFGVTGPGIMGPATALLQFDRALAGYEITVRINGSIVR